jgi:hypothetical protein
MEASACLLFGSNRDLVYSLFLDTLDNSVDVWQVRRRCVKMHNATMRSWSTSAQSKLLNTLLRL